MKPERPSGMTLLAVGFYILGGATLIAYPLGLLRGFPSTVLEGFLAIVGLVYGALALWSGRLVWNLDRVASRVFVAWCLSLILFNGVIVLESPELLNPWLLPPAIFAAGVLTALYFYIRRHCESAA